MQSVGNDTGNKIAMTSALRCAVRLRLSDAVEHFRFKPIGLLLILLQQQQLKSLLLLSLLPQQLLQVLPLPGFPLTPQTDVSTFENTLKTSIIVCVIAVSN